MIEVKTDTTFPGGHSFVHRYAVTVERLTEQDFANLLEFRTAMRRFNRWSERQAGAVGLTHAQHQLLLAVKGHGDARGPTISVLAEYLLLRHHSTVELVNRVESAGLVRRFGDPDDARVVRIKLTAEGEDRLARLTSMHIDELQRLTPILEHLVEESADPDGSPGNDSPSEPER